jgi:hypothetical protein
MHAHDETRAITEIKEAHHPGSLTDEFVNTKVAKLTRTRNHGKVNRLEKRLFKGHEFELRFSSDNKNKAKREAQKYHKRGFHTRVRELYTGVFSVYTRSKRAQ